MDQQRDSTTTLGQTGTEIPTTETASTETASTEIDPSPEIVPTVKEPPVEEVQVAAVEPVSLISDDTPTPTKKKKTTRKKRKRGESTTSSSSLNHKISKLERDVRQLTKRVDSIQKRMPRCPLSKSPRSLP